MGAFCSAHDQEGLTTPQRVKNLEYSCTWGNLPVLKKEIESGTNINAEILQGRPMLYVCAWQNRQKCVEYLIEQKADVNKRTNGGNTSLYVASGGGYSEIVRILLENKADPNLKTETDDQTPLFAAISFPSFECVKLLCNYGAKVHISNKFDQNVYNLCEREGRTVTRIEENKKIVEYLHEYQNQIEEACLDIVFSFVLQLPKPISMGWITEEGNKLEEVRTNILVVNFTKSMVIFRNFASRLRIEMRNGNKPI